jgi:beta-lactamase class A
MLKNLFAALLLLTLLSFQNFAQTNQLKNQIEKIISAKKAEVGVAVYGIENKFELTVNNEKHYPMQSVFKFHLALAVLKEVDNGRLDLAQKIYVKKSDLLPDTWSPLRDAYPNGEVDLPLSEIIQYTISRSDNNGCDILFKLIGGPKIVNDYIHGLGIENVSIQANEEEMHKDWNVQFSNWTTPKAATDLLVLSYTGNILSKHSYDFLWKCMIETSTGPNKIKGNLPEGTPVAHKTGLSGKDDNGITAASNDIGIVTLPNGEHFAISVFVTNSPEEEKINEKIIAEITKAFWDYFTSHTK